MNHKLLMDTAVLAGEIMLCSGAETYRVEDTMCHILKTSECESIEAFALMTGIVTTINDETMDQPITTVKTINERSTNLNNIIKVNEISRRYCGGKISLEEAYEQLKCVKEKQYSRAVFNIATAAIATGFAMMFGGSVIDVMAATMVGFWLAACIMLGKMIRINSIFVDIFSCAGIAMITMAVKTFLVPTLNMDIVIVSAIMPIVPGVAITNAIRDTLQGDYLSGCARILEAFLKAASIAIGAGIGMALFNMLIGGGII
ncbi:MAG: threonine/serine exporter family protein [Tyzzerella sp.]|nr:threonine/serine exporter family protein [Tyzzerella sp.]